MTKLLTLGISFSTAVRAVALKTELVAKLEILGILPLNSFTLTSRAALVAVAKLVTLDILSSIF